ncbi:MAG: hypothetical protein WCI48_13390 [Bacteroidota bacterium]
MKTKEEWVDKAMESLDGAGRAELNPFVRERILQGFSGTVKEQSALKPGLAWKIAAIILLLISLNVFTIVYYHKSSAGSSNPAKSVASEYFSYIDHYNL